MPRISKIGKVQRSLRYIRDEISVPGVDIHLTIRGDYQPVEVAEAPKLVESVFEPEPEQPTFEPTEEQMQEGRAYMRKWHQLSKMSAMPSGALEHFREHGKWSWD